MFLLLFFSLTHLLKLVKHIMRVIVIFAASHVRGLSIFSRASGER